MLLRKTKAKFVVKTNVKNLNNINKFWETMKSSFSGKRSALDKIFLYDDENVIIEEGEAAQEFNNHSTVITLHLHLNRAESFSVLSLEKILVFMIIIKF